MADDCEAFADLLDAAGEGALPPAAMAAVGAHVAGCASCRDAMEATAALRAELAALPRDTAPSGLAATIRASLPPAPPGRRRVLELVAAGVAGLTVGAALRWPSQGQATHDAFAAHGRAMLAGLPMQVASSDQHTVRPWLSARLPFSPRVAEPEGFTLLGARLDLIDGQIVAALLYRRREHVVSVFCAPADWPDAPVSRQGLNLLAWRAEGLRYLAVSDVALAELRVLAAALGAQRGMS